MERPEFKDVVGSVESFCAGKISDAEMQNNFNYAIRRYSHVSHNGDGLIALDACCGAGQGSLLLRKYGYDVHAFDFFDKQKEILKAHGVKFRQSRIEDYVPDCKFDLICGMEMIEHVIDPEGTLDKFADWVKPNGLVFVSIPTEGTCSPNPFHLHAWTIEQVKEMVSVRFTIANSSEFGFGGRFWFLRPRGT